MRKKTVEKIKKIINETISRKYWGNRVAMPYVKNGGLGDITWQQLGGSPADSNSFVSYMTLNYYNKEYLDPVVAGIQARLDSVEDTLYPHVNDSTIHVTSADKTNWNKKVDSIIKEINDHETINTHEVPTLTVEDVTDLYIAVVGGNLVKIHFDPDELGITSDFLVEEGSNVTDIGIKFMFQDSMILTYTIAEDPEDPTQEVVNITYKEIGGGTQPHLYRHNIHIFLKTEESSINTTIINNSETPFTNTTFLQYIMNNFDLNSPYSKGGLSCSGYVIENVGSGSVKSIPYKISHLKNSNFVIEAFSLTDMRYWGIYFSSIDSISDTVEQIF